MYSFHYFLFPFRFDYLENEVNDRHDFYKEKAFDERVFKKLPILFEKLKNSEWEYLPFEIKEAEFYNEFVYFHDFVKDSLFNLNESFDKNSTSYFFRKKLNRLKIYLDVKKFSGFEKTYELDLISITLRIFDTGIGILAFEVENHKYENKEDVLNINEYFRRIYPPFVGKGFSFEEVNKKYMANFVIKDEDENNESKKYKLDLEKDFQNIKGLKIAPYILEILGEDTFTQNIKEKNKFLIQPVIDERMFVMCWYGNDEMASLAKECWYECKDDEKKYWKLKDFWYEFLFVDANGKSIANKKIQEELLEKSTYLRWQEYGTLYGISRYSFVNLTSSKETLKRNYADYLIENFKGVYYQLVVLALAIRASVLRFSDEVTAISDLEPDENLYERVSNLYKNYLKFVNKLYFREVSSQEQAIEIYEMFQNIMRLERDVKDLDSEINKLGSYVYMIQEKEENKEMKDLTKIATIFLPPSLVAGIFGMNVFGEGLTTHFISLIFAIFILIGSVVGLPYYMPFILKVMEKISKKGRNDNKTDNTFNSF